MLTIDLRDQLIFIAGIGDDQGFGWACAHACAEAGARVIAGTWVPMVKILERQLAAGKFLESQRLSSGRLLEFEAILPLDVRYDTPDQVPEETRLDRRYQDYTGYSIQEVADRLHGWDTPLRGFVHAIALAPEIRHPLLETSRAGYLEALSSSAYSWVSMVRRLGPLLSPGDGCITLSYRASHQVIPGYGGGMSSAKASLESDTRTLAWEAGRAYGIRVNALSPGVWPSRAARAIGGIEAAVEESRQCSPLQKAVTPKEVGSTAAFLLSPLASAITGTVLMVDQGLHVMGAGIPSTQIIDAQ